MEEEKKLCPFRLCTLEDKFPWGTEEWNLADLGWRDSIARDGWLCGNTMGEIMETYLDRVVGDEVFDWYGQQFPFAVKTLHVNGKMPLLACPDDALARDRYGLLGKEKLWYVMSADKGAKLLLGMRRSVDVSEFMDACASGAADSLMNSVSIKPGDYFHIPANVPHCILGKADVLEISQSSALDFCLCTWGETLPENDLELSLGLVDALDFVRLDKFPAEGLMGFSMEARRDSDPENVSRMLTLPQFSSSLIALGDPLKISAGEAASCVAYTCVRGELSVQLPMGADDKIDYLVVAAGETVLIPAECDEFFLVPRGAGTSLVETLVEPRSEADPYIDPSAEPHLPGEE